MNPRTLGNQPGNSISKSSGRHRLRRPPVTMAHRPASTAGAALIGATALAGALVAVPPQHAIQGSVAASHLMVLHESLDLPTAALDLGVAAELFADVAVDIAAFVDVGVTGLGTAVEWAVQLVDLIAAGGVDLFGELSEVVVSLVNGGLPDLDFAAAVAVLAELVNQVALGVDTGLLVWAEAVNLGADIVGGIAQLPGALGVALNAGITAAVLAGLEALVPIVGPLPAGLVGAVTTISGLLDTAITLPGEAIAWKAELDAVLADLVAAGGVALTNELTGGLMGAVGATPVGLPDIDGADVDASLGVVIDHVTVELADVFVGDSPAAAESEPTLAPTLTQDPEIPSAQAVNGPARALQNPDPDAAAAAEPAKEIDIAPKKSSTGTAAESQAGQPSVGDSATRASTLKPDRGSAPKNDRGAESTNP